MYIEQSLKYKSKPAKYAGGICVSILGMMAAQILVLVVLNVGNVSFEMPNIIDNNTLLLVMLVPFAVGLLCLLGWVKVVHKQPIVSLTTSRKTVDFGRLLFSFVLCGGVLLVSFGIDFWANHADYTFSFRFWPFFNLLLVALLFIPPQIAFEEYIFRGYLMQLFGQVFRNRWVPLVVTSLCFGGLHFMNPEVEKFGPSLLIFYILTGGFLGAIVLLDEGLELALGFHLANNFFTAILTTSPWSALHTDALFTVTHEPSFWEILFQIIPLFIIFVVFAKRYAWKNYKTKLLGKISPEKPSDETPYS